ncbi:hypothetical protein [Mycetocola sp. 2940]|uniref:hypothetical protein n=1 Tax=Mycetocola sp. 2940 TaxID=3156452 RepID=UPI00339AE0EB
MSSPSPASAITGTWVWGNSVDPAVDERGRGQPDLAPRAIAEFARSKRLDRVFCNAPWSTHTEPMRTWFADAVASLAEAGVDVAVLGGTPEWFDRPTLAATWLTDARATAAFPAVQLDVEPWTEETVDPAHFVPGFLRLVETVRASAGPITVGADLPCWLARTPHGSGSVFDAIVRDLDSVAILAYSDHAEGTGGILELATPVVLAAAASGVRFTIGVETDTPEIAGGKQHTFFDEGSVVLEAEAAKVRAAFAAIPGYDGVTVEHLLAWKRLRR